MRVASLKLAAAAALLFCGVALGRDLVQVDAKMAFYDRNRNVAWVQPCEDCWSSYLGQRDSAGIAIYDTLVRVVLVYELEDHDTIEIHEIDWLEWAYKLHLRSEMQAQDNETVWISLGAKLNQASAAAGPEEARRWWTPDYYDDYWPLLTHVQNIRFNTPDFVTYSRPYYSNFGFLRLVQFAPDTVVEMGYNPSRFRYLTVHLSAVPFFHDTLRVSAAWYPECSRTHWTAEDAGDPDRPTLPTYPAIDCVPQDPLRPGVYHVDESQLGLPAGTYEVRARVAGTIGRPSYSFTVDPAVDLDGVSRSSYEISLTPDQAGQNPQVVEFWHDSAMVARKPLGFLEARWPDSLGRITPIPRWENR